MKNVFLSITLLILGACSIGVERVGAPPTTFSGLFPTPIDPTPSPTADISHLPFQLMFSRLSVPQCLKLLSTRGASSQTYTSCAQPTPKAYENYILRDDYPVPSHFRCDGVLSWLFYNERGLKYNKGPCWDAFPTGSQARLTGSLLTGERLPHQIKQELEDDFNENKRGFLESFLEPAEIDRVTNPFPTQALSSGPAIQRFFLNNKAPDPAAAPVFSTIFSKTGTLNPSSGGSPQRFVNDGRGRPAGYAAYDDSQWLDFAVDKTGAVWVAITDADYVNTAAFDPTSVGPGDRLLPPTSYSYAPIHSCSTPANCVGNPYAVNGNTILPKERSFWAETWQQGLPSRNQTWWDTLGAIQNKPVHPTLYDISDTEQWFSFFFFRDSNGGNAFWGSFDKNQDDPRFLNDPMWGGKISDQLGFDFGRCDYDWDLARCTDPSPDTWENWDQSKDVRVQLFQAWGYRRYGEFMQRYLALDRLRMNIAYAVEAPGGLNLKQAHYGHAFHAPHTFPHSSVLKHWGDSISAGYSPGNMQSNVLYQEYSDYFDWEKTGGPGHVTAPTINKAWNQVNYKLASVHSSFAASTLPLVSVITATDPLLPDQNTANNFEGTEYYHELVFHALVMSERINYWRYNQGSGGAGAGEDINALFSDRLLGQLMLEFNEVAPKDIVGHVVHERFAWNKPFLVSTAELPDRFVSRISLNQLSSSPWNISYVEDTQSKEVVFTAVPKSGNGPTVTRTFECASILVPSVSNSTAGVWIQQSALYGPECD